MNQRKAVIGIHSLGSGDAVSNDVIGMYRALEWRGVDVRVFRSDHAERLGLRQVEMAEVPWFLMEPEDLFIYHHCGHSPVGEDLFRNLACRKILRYHNVTPPEFFADFNAEYTDHCTAGRAVLEELYRSADTVWAPSRFNLADFRNLQVEPRPEAVFPPFHQTERLLGLPIDATLDERLAAAAPFALFVGRFAPNKNHELLVRALRAARDRGLALKLAIAGGRDGRLSAYSRHVERLVRDLKLEHEVLFLGKVTDAELATLYRRAAVFLSASRHEGFCVPLVEAMAFGVPIVALSRAAVPETLAEAGVLVASEAPEALAAALADVLDDPARARELARAGQTAYRRRFGQAAVENAFLAAVAPELARDARAVRAVHQFHSGSAYGDAVTNSMLLIRELLRELGFASDIYVEHIAPGLADELRPHTALQPSADDLVLVHHSMGHDLDRWLAALPARKVLVYHNITPAEYFPPGSAQALYSRKGREQLRSFRDTMAAAIAVSGYNAEELRGLGYRDTEVIPLLFDLAALREHPCNEELVRRESAVPTLLFVGRVVRHKGQHLLLEVAKHLQHVFNERFQLVCVGGYDRGDPYWRELNQTVEAGGLADVVRFTGKVPATDLYAWYRAARAFICLSEHEGFGVPLVEAMAFGVPVIAHASGNVAETLGGAGLLVRTRRPDILAALAKLLLADSDLRRRIAEGQGLRLLDLERERLAGRLALFLARQGATLPKPAADGS